MKRKIFYHEPHEPPRTEEKKNFTTNKREPTHIHLITD